MNSQDLQEVKQEDHSSGDLAPEDRTHHMRSMPEARSGLVIT